MGKLKIEDFKIWLKKIEDGAKREASKGKNIRKWANTEIKKKFKDELKKLKPNTNYEYEIRPNNDKGVRQYHKGGWLYDFCLRKLKISGNTKTEKPKEIINLEKMILAMEIEMTQKDGSIRNDFHKLLQADAEYKIMVFQCRKNDDGDVSDTIEMLKKQVEDYKPQSNSKYLLCGWSISRLQFEIDAFTVENGGINEIKIG